MRFHQGQLEALGVPESLYRKLFAKLRYDEFNAGQFFEIVLDESKGRFARTIGDMKKDDDIFLIDHVWTFKRRTAM